MTERTDQYLIQMQNVPIVYNIYRLLLPLILLMTFLGPDSTLLGDFDPVLFVEVCTAYTVFAVVVLFFLPSGETYLSKPHLVIGCLLIDVLAITLVIYSSGGIASGLGLLLIITIASGSILIRGRKSTFIAAVATLATIYSESYLSLVLENPLNQFIQTGILGTVLFATSLFIQTLTVRIYRSAQLADKQASDIRDLEKLNNEIIQRMRTGIVVVNCNHQVVSMNTAAKQILSPTLKSSDDDIDQKSALPEILATQLKLWKLNAMRRALPISIPDSTRQIQVNFAFLNTDTDSDILVFLEDHRQIVQKVRQTKLASLGRLTASIAHEVRNPLSAISHATQLMQESNTLADDDRRLLEIVLEHCNRINRIIEDILGASRYDDTTPTSIVLKDWLELFIHNYRATHESCDEISFEIQPDDIKINVIEGQLEQVLNNLFDNGLRYSEKNTGRATLEIRAEVDVRNGYRQPCLHIIDDGIGVDAETESKLFEPFYTTETSGTGLGLYISKELCEANQSQLIYSKTDKGKCCFSIYFSNPDLVIA